MSDFHDFNERLEFSEGVDLLEEIEVHILNSIPASTRIVPAEEKDDKNGTDRWIYRAHGLPRVSVDFKNREFCPIEKFKSDDACIETTSVYTGPSSAPWVDRYRIKPGWTIDERKRTDLIVYTWPHEQDLFGAARMRFWILYFPHLCEAARRNWRTWAEEYGERRALNNGYVTLAVYPPRKIIAKAIRDITTGVITA